VIDGPVIECFSYEPDNAEKWRFSVVAMDRAGDGFFVQGVMVGRAVSGPRSLG